MTTRPEPATSRPLPTVITSTEMRQHWMQGNVRQVTPLTDVVVAYADHWWCLDGEDAWVRVTDQALAKVYEQTHQRWREIERQLHQKTKG